jgi:hypothetical protein
MKIHRQAVFILLVIFCIGLLPDDSMPIKAGDKKYEIRPQIILPDYGIISAGAPYERLMEQYTQFTESAILRIEQQLDSILDKLEQMDAKITQLSQRMETIESALKIRQANDSNSINDFVQKNTNQKFLKKKTLQDSNDLCN